MVFDQTPSMLPLLAVLLLYFAPQTKVSTQVRPENVSTCELDLWLATDGKESTLDLRNTMSPVDTSAAFQGPNHIVYVYKLYNQPYMAFYITVCYKSNGAAWY